MLFYIRQGDVEHRVRIESRRGQLYLKWDGDKEELLDIHYFGNDCSLIRENRVFCANIVGDKHKYTVWRPEGNLDFTVESEYRRIVGMLRGQQLANEHNVYAKMPGKIVKITAKKGDTVAQGASLLVMEAMKMENDIRATAAGEISNILVAEGQAVETGALLIEVTPAE